MKGKIVNPQHRPYLQGNPSHVTLDLSQLKKSQRGLETANPVTRILLTWTAQAALQAFSLSKGTSTRRAC